MDQAQRDRVMGRLRSGNADLLVATDVAARGLDVEQLTHVFNYDVPAAPESYVHRIGRVGRGGREGVAITIADPREGRQLNAIERSTKQKIRIATLPSSDDLRSRRLELTRAALERVCRDGDLDQYRGVWGSLTEEFDFDRVALAAIKMAHIATVGEADEEVIPQPGFATTSGGKKSRDGKRSRDDSGSRGRDRRGDDDRKGHSGKDSDRKDFGGKKHAGKKHAGKTSVGKKRIYIGLGKDAGVRPQDVVGAIANETRLSGSDVGAIDISSRFTTVEVPADSAKEVIAALSSTRIQGRKPKARLDRH